MLETFLKMLNAASGLKKIYKKKKTKCWKTMQKY